MNWPAFALGRLGARAPGRAEDQGALDAAISDVGLARSSNEDAYVRRPDVGLWAVADGMGGHEDGEWASGAITAALDAAPMTGDFDIDCGLAAQAVRQAHGRILDRAGTRRQRMGSTVVALVARGERFCVLWAGDSRAYRLRNGRLAQLTVDHTQVQLKVDRGLLSADEARAHPMAHVLTRAVGVEASVDLAQASGAVEAGDRFVLCSDGLHGVASEAEIAEALRGHAPARACQVLLGLCHARGAPDNVTVIIVDPRPGT